uniref:hypothetical protein n=1 Tax=Pseudonocardia sp. CA-138482 TaxID=3240023 RepID=UPI003F499116
MKLKVWAVAGAAAAGLLLAGCAATTPGSPVSPTGTVSANTATGDQLVAAFTAHGVPDPQRWAAEVDEYRPYPMDDPTLDKLQDNLAKYHPSPETLAGILASLTP